jgi:glycosyltransferase involved in cell wall biosynthesis
MLLSAAIIVRDEAEHLDACLASIEGFVDEIVVVDTGSTDDTVAVAERHGAVIGHEPWNDDFATPRNRSLDLASGEWILYIDADERVQVPDPNEVREILRIAAGNHLAFRVRFAPRLGWTPYFEFRLWRHDPDIRFHGSIHESMVRSIERVARREGLRIGKLDDILPGGLTIQHLGYEGDQRHKHARNEPMLVAALAETPDRPFLYDHLARIYEDRGEHDKARATWHAGMAIARARSTAHPDDRLLWINLLVHCVVREDPDGEVPELIAEAQNVIPHNTAHVKAHSSH